MKFIYILTVIFFISGARAQGGDDSLRHYVQAQDMDADAPARVSACSRLANGLKRNLGWCATMLGIGGASAAVFYQQYATEKEMGVIERYAISGGCTAAIEKVLIPALCLPTFRVVMSQLQNTRLATCLGLHRRIDTHKAVASAFVLAAATHSACSIWDNSKFLQSREGKTGAVMWSAILLPLVGSYFFKDMPCLRQCNYIKKFLRPHQFGFLLFAVGYSLHRPDLSLLPWIGIPVGGLAIDRCLEYVFFTHSTNITDAKIEGDKVVLTVARPAKMKISAGQFVYLKINGRYHPLTVAWFSGDDIGFVIAAAGPGTRELFACIEADKFPQSSATKISGPYSSPFQGTTAASSIIAISSGSGVSVSTSTLQKEGVGAGQENITIIHSERNSRSFWPLIEAVDQARRNGVGVQEVHLFLTGQSPDVESEEGNLSQLRRKITDAGMRFTAGPLGHYQNLAPPGDEVCFFLHRGRFNPAHLTSESGGGLVLLQDPQAHVFISGNPKIVEMVERFCSTYGLRYTEEAFRF